MPEEMILGHRKVDRRPNTQTNILTGTAWNSMAYRCLTYRTPHMSSIYTIQIYCCDSPGNTKHILMAIPGNGQTGEEEEHAHRTYKAQT